MKKLLLLAFVTFLIKNEIVAQDLYRNEVGVFLGGSYYTGDLNPKSHFLLTKFAGGIVYRYNITPRWAFKASALLGWLEGSDAKSKANVERNLSFKTYLFDFSPQIEFNFLPYIMGDKKHFITPYIFVGASVFNFKPRAQDSTGKWFDLNSMGTEGQGTTQEGKNKPYSLTSIAIPFGLGLKISPSKSISLGLEWGIRKTFTDYIDDVSTVYPDYLILSSEKGMDAVALSDKSPVPLEDLKDFKRGDPKTKDWYVFTGLTLTVRIKKKTERCAAYKQHPNIKNKYVD
jgi:hypothetical protein